MTNLGQVLKRDVSKTLLDHKYPVTFSRKRQGGTYDVDTAKITGSTPDSETVYGVFVSRYTSRGPDGSVVNNVKTFLMDPSGLTKEPQDGDELTKDGSTDIISRVRAVKSGGTIVLYACEVK